MEFNISNPHEIYKGDFERMVAMQTLETFTKSQVDQFMNQAGDLLEKSEYSELSDIEKSIMNNIQAEVSSMNKWIVVDNNFQKSLMFTRPRQVVWGEPEDNIIKGIYADTGLNRKLDRVGKEVQRTIPTE